MQINNVTFDEIAISDGEITDGVAAFGELEGVRAFTADQGVLAFAAKEGVIAFSSFESIAEGLAVEQIIT